MRIWLFPVLFLYSCGSSYFPYGSYSSGPPPSIWMVTQFNAGVQCMEGDWDAVYEEKRANIEADLTFVGIERFEEVVVKGATCRACGCTMYKGLYFIQIDAAEETEHLAKELGFWLTSPPSVDSKGNRRY